MWVMDRVKPGTTYGDGGAQSTFRNSSNSKTALDTTPGRQAHKKGPSLDPSSSSGLGMSGTLPNIKGPALSPTLFLSSILVVKILVCHSERGSELETDADFAGY